MKIRLNGPVVDDSESWIYEMFGIEAIYPKKVNRMLDRLSNEQEEVTICINSGGGSVFAASEIYSSLKSHKGTVTAEIVGIAASAASVFAMAADVVTISPTAQIMIHNAAMGNYGDHKSMDQAGKILQGVNDSIRQAYLRKTGMTAEELTTLMDEETWMTAERAVEKKFADRIMFEEETPALGFVASHQNGALPHAVISKMQEMIAKGAIDSGENKDGEQPDVLKNLLGKEVGISTNTTDSASSSAQKKTKGDDKMDLETIKNEHPALYETIKNEGVEEGRKLENSRIRDIEDLAYPGVENLVHAAKFENNGSAADLAVAIVKAEKAAGSAFLADRNADSKAAGTVPPSAGDGADKTDVPKNDVNSLIAAMGGKK